MRARRFRPCRAACLRSTFCSSRATRFGIRPGPARASAPAVGRLGRFDQSVAQFSQLCGLSAFVDQRYASYNSGIGRSIERGSATFESLQKYIIAKGEVDANGSARQEYLENLFVRQLK